MKVVIGVIRNSTIIGTGAGALTKATAEGLKVTKVTGYEYRLPKFTKGEKLLFIGDSITDMKWGRNEKDRNHYLGHSYVYLIASRLGVDMPEAKLECFNRGHSGNRIIDLKSRWQKDVIDMKPDLLSILVGINDVGRTVSKDKGFDEWEANYRFILDASRKANPDLRLVLLDPFVLASGRLSEQTAFQAKRELVDRLCVIVAQLAKDYKAVHLKTQEVFDAAAKGTSQGLLLAFNVGVFGAPPQHSATRNGRCHIPAFLNRDRRKKRCVNC